MNERIKELWLQAGGHYDSGNQHTWPEYTIDDPEKFAELIARECARVILETPVDYMETDTMHRIRDSVKQHFGVEE